MSSSLRITDDQFRAAVAAGVRAPSMYNAQPWRFTCHDDSIDVRVDSDRLLPVADPDRWAAYIACGAAVANIRLALAESGYATSLQPALTDADERRVARVSVVGRGQLSPLERALWSAIPRRYSNRLPFLDTAVPAASVAQLTAAAAQAGGWLVVVDGRENRARIGEIVRDADSRLHADPAYVAELEAWTGRHSAEPAGIRPESAGVVPASHDPLAMRDFGGPTRAQSRDYEPDPVIAVLGYAGRSRHDTVRAGVALQLVLLTATHEGLATSMLSQPIEVPEAREELRNALGRHGTPHMVLRIGHGQPGSPTARRPVEDVIDEPAHDPLG